MNEQCKVVKRIMKQRFPLWDVQVKMVKAKNYALSSDKIIITTTANKYRVVETLKRHSSGIRNNNEV